MRISGVRLSLCAVSSRGGNCDTISAMERVARHYGQRGLVDAIWRGLRAEGKDPFNLEVDDLAPVDEFHIRGREATVELAGLAQLSPGMRILDVGSGLGGSSRYLAAYHGARVTGVDVTPEYCEVAAELSRCVGLDGQTDFHCCSAVETPFENDSFDLAWTQHVQMNIEDKQGLYSEILRVLRPGGRLVFHDILAGPGGEPHFPVHWAEEPSMSFLIDPDALRALLRDIGFDVVDWRDTTKISQEWFLSALEQRGDGPPPNLGLHLLIGDTGPAKAQNVGRNLEEQRITVFQGAAVKP